MSKESANTITDTADDEQKTESQLSSDYLKNSITDGVNATVISNPEMQLVQRQPYTSKSDKNVDAKKDTKEGSSLATLDVGDLQTVTLGHLNKIDVLKDENGLGKGVVLNATQLYPVGWVPDTVGKDIAKDHELKQSYLVAGNHVFETSMEKKEQLTEAKKDEMSLARKILFGVSFLPSILFVLCFAIILPCQEPRSISLCEKILWSAVFNETDLVTGFAVTSRALLISSLERNEKLISLNADTGEEMWNATLKTSVIQMECHKFDASGDDIYDCLVMTKDGLLYAYNISNGYIFWNYTISRDKSNFVILPDCDKDGFPEIAVAVSPSEIQIISNGSPRRPVVLSGCNTMPKNLTAWVNEEESNLIYVCQTDSGHESLAYVKQDTWCSKEKTLKAVTIELLNSFRDQVNMEHMLLKPTSDGLVVWANDFLAFFEHNGKERWQTFTSDHVTKTYLFYGNFSSTQKHVALIGGASTSHSLVTLIDASSGNETFSHIFKEAIVENAVFINGKKQDSLLVLLKEISEEKQNASMMDTSFAINPPITVRDIELLKLPKPIEPKHRLVLLQFQIKDSRLSLQEKYIRSEVIPHKEESTSLAAYVDENDLKIYLGQTYAAKHTTIQAFRVNNWDQTELPQCK